MSDKKLDVTKLYEIHDAIITDELSDERLKGQDRTDSNCEHIFGAGYMPHDRDALAFKCKKCGFIDYFTPWR
jgi:hypothetical protein